MNGKGHARGSSFDSLEKSTATGAYSEHSYDLYDTQTVNTANTAISTAATSDYGEDGFSRHPMGQNGLPSVKTYQAAQRHVRADVTRPSVAPPLGPSQAQSAYSDLNFQNPNF